MTTTRKRKSHNLRLNKILAETGLFSRRKADQAIKDGRVAVNGRRVTDLSLKADPLNDLITVDNNPVKTEPKTYILLNKPAGCLSTCTDDRGRKTVVDLVEHISERVFPVGRLDYNTTGLLILTNDGDFAQKISHPSSGALKKYRARVRGKPEGKVLKKMTSGITIEGIKHKFHAVKVEKATGKNTTLAIELYEGKNRHIKKLCAALGHPVSKLSRIAFGPLKLTGLEPGDYRHLMEKEITALKSAVGKRSLKKTKSPKSRKGR